MIVSGRAEGGEALLEDAVVAAALGAGLVGMSVKAVHQ